MLKDASKGFVADVDPAETAEWLDSLEDVLHRHGPARVQQLLSLLQDKAYREGVTLPFSANTPYINTISVDSEPPYPGNREIERRIKSIIRWNAMAMVVRANADKSLGIGGHISTFGSSATLLEVGFNHFFRGRKHSCGGDVVYFQGHGSPGIYARAFLEGRLTEKHLENFRRELRPEGGLSSYPHPWLMPDFWQFPTVSMGLGPIMAIYHARFLRYLADRGLANTADKRVWCFVGDGEVDEPETLGALTLASRENLDNLIFVVNCNLQRLDGPVRGNGKIIQELEAAFRGAGWNCIKVIWGGDWDPLLDRDESGALVKRMGEVVDGQYQKYVVSDGAYIREHFFGANPELLSLVEHLSDEALKKLTRGGHDPKKVFAAYKAATEHVGSPTVILAKTIKGYGMGETGEGRNITHQQKSLNEMELREFRSRFGIPIPDDEIAKAPFYVPPQDSPEMRYLHDRREELGGYLPSRDGHASPPLDIPGLDKFEKYLAGGSGSTTQAFVRLFGWLLRDKAIGKLIVPIIPDEARTFGMEGLFRQCGIYAHNGQLYEPVDSDQLLYYREEKDGQILEEGINEAGAMSSFIAAGTAYANHGVPTIPFFIYYSMFGFQRVGDLIWAAADSRCRGFLLGATAGRTTLAGEGLQHQDGHSHLLAATVPNCVTYDPAYAYEVAVIIQDGLRRMYKDRESVFYYITLHNEDYEMPPMPEQEGVVEGILKGMYRVKSVNALSPKTEVRPQLFGSGAILRETLKAQSLLAEKYGVSTDTWSVTSYKELRREGLEVDHWNRRNPDKAPRKCFVQQATEGLTGPFVAASDYMHLVSEQISRWLPGDLVTLGTDGFGRSEARKELRSHFEVDAANITYATLQKLMADGEYSKEDLLKARDELGIDPNKPDPVSV